MTSSTQRHILRTARQRKRLEGLASRGLDTTKWRDKPKLKAYVIFGRWPTASGSMKSDAILNPDQPTPASDA